MNVLPYAIAAGIGFGGVFLAVAIPGVNGLPAWSIWAGLGVAGGVTAHLMGAHHLLGAAVASSAAAIAATSLGASLASSSSIASTQ